MSLGPNPGATAAEFAEARFGGPTRPSDTDVVVGVAVTVIAANNPRRVMLAMTNNGTSPINFAIGKPPTLGFGHTLAPNGGWVVLTVEEDGEAVAWDVQGIANAAGQNVHVTEVMRV